MTKKKNHIYLLLLAAALLIAACTSERSPCLQPVNVSIFMEFKRKVTDTGAAIIDTSFANMIMNPLDSPRRFMDTGSIVGALSPNSLQLRLSPVADSCRWYLQPDSAFAQRRDTLTFYYRRDLHFISNACGYTYYYFLDSVHVTPRLIADPYHSVDSVKLLYNTVNGDASKTHLRIYFHKP